MKKAHAKTADGWAEDRTRMGNRDVQLRGHRCQLLIGKGVEGVEKSLPAAQSRRPVAHWLLALGDLPPTFTSKYVQTDYVYRTPTISYCLATQTARFFLTAGRCANGRPDRCGDGSVLVAVRSGDPFFHFAALRAVIRPFVAVRADLAGRRGRVVRAFPALAMAISIDPLVGNSPAATDACGRGRTGCAFWITCPGLYPYLLADQPPLAGAVH